MLAKVPLNGENADANGIRHLHRNSTPGAFGPWPPLSSLAAKS
jgi:hypothetical protein